MDLMLKIWFARFINWKGARSGTFENVELIQLDYLLIECCDLWSCCVLVGRLDLTLTNLCGVCVSIWNSEFLWNRLLLFWADLVVLPLRLAEEGLVMFPF